MHFPDHSARTASSYLSAPENGFRGLRGGDVPRPSTSIIINPCWLGSCQPGERNQGRLGSGSAGSEIKEGEGKGLGRTMAGIVLLRGAEALSSLSCSCPLGSGWRGGHSAAGALPSPAAESAPCSVPVPGQCRRPKSRTRKKGGNPWQEEQSQLHLGRRDGQRRRRMGHGKGGPSLCPRPC